MLDKINFDYKIPRIFVLLISCCYLNFQFKMKFLVLALFAVAVAAEIDYSAPEWNIDWSDAVPIEDMPGFWDDKYELPVEVFKHNARSSRIVGGVEVVHGEHPYQLSILMQFATGQGLCGASIITQTRVLTAGKLRNSSKCKSNSSSYSALPNQQPVDFGHCWCSQSSHR